MFKHRQQLDQDNGFQQWVTVGHFQRDRTHPIPRCILDGKLDGLGDFELLEDREVDRIEVSGF
ncbi:hypothetical protein D3C76_1884550 [compost metagenome]